MPFALRILLATCFMMTPFIVAHAEDEVKTVAQDASAPAATDAKTEKKSEEKSATTPDANATGASADKAAKDEANKTKDRAESPTYEAVEEKPLYWMCRNKNDVRTLRLEAKDKACKTMYSKEGNERIVSQSVQVPICYHVFANIRRNLEFGDYKCKDISNSRVSSSY